MYRFANTHSTRMKRYIPGIHDPADAPDWCEVCQSEGHTDSDCDLYFCRDCGERHEHGTRPCDEQYVCEDCHSAPCECRPRRAVRIPDAITLGCERYHARKEEGV